MGMLSIRNGSGHQFTLVANDFIDSYMTKANGEYVKVYLLLLRRMDSGKGFSVSELADILEITEGDILRAFRYWAKEGLLTIEYGAGGDISGLLMGNAETENKKNETTAKTQDSLSCSDPLAEAESSPQEDEPWGAIPEHTEEPAHADSSAKKETAPPIRDIGQYKSRKEFKQLLFITEKYIGRPLSPSDVEMMSYFYDTLQFSADLVEYLVEYCVENGHKSMHYIKSVALAWADAGISSVSEARRSASFYNKDCSAVLKAFGITGRMAASVETDFVKKWSSEFGFTLDIIIEACNRTVSAIHQPSFEYADKILSNWHNKGVHHLKDVAMLDQAYLQHRSARASSPAPTAKKTKFNNFEERNYNMEDLERQLLES